MKLMLTSASIYSQAYEKTYAESIIIDTTLSEYQQIECKECYGTGYYWITDIDGQTCNVCKGSGLIWFNAY